MKKILNIIMLLASGAMSFGIMFSMISVKVPTLSIIILLGIFDYVLTWFSEREFNNSFSFFNMLSNQAHPWISKLWDFAKKLLLLLFIKFIGFDLFSAYLNTTEISEKRILFEGMIFVGGTAAILTSLSAILRSVYKNEYSVYKNRKHNFKIQIPNYWSEVEVPDNSNAVMAFAEQMSDKACYIFVDDKVDYVETATLQDFSSLRVDLFKEIDDFEIKKMSRIEDEKINYYEFDVVYRKKKYSTYLFFDENKDYFYEIRVIIPRKNKQDEEHIKIMETLKTH
ncbi:MAG: hypothetical protein ACQEQF_10785 [Bacillota bacterium]